MEWLIASARKVVVAAKSALAAAEAAENAAVEHLRSLLLEAEALLAGLEAHRDGSSSDQRSSRG